MACYIVVDGKRLYRKYKRVDGVLMTRARAVYIAAYGPIPDGMDVHHKWGTVLERERRYARYTGECRRDNLCNGMY